MKNSVTFTRTIIPNSGHLGDATKFAKKRLAAIKKSLGVNVGLKVRLGGKGGELIMISHHKDLNELQKVRTKLMRAVLKGKIPQPKPGLVKSVNDAVWIKA